MIALLRLVSTAPWALRRSRSASVNPPAARPPTRRKSRRENWRLSMGRSCSRSRRSILAYQPEAQARDTVGLSLALRVGMPRRKRQLSDDLANQRRAFGDAYRSAVGGVEFLVGVDAEQVIQRATIADRRIVFIDDAQRGAIGGAEDHALAEAAAGDEDELRRAPVI